MSLEPTPAGLELRRRLADRDEVLKSVLSETLQSAQAGDIRESGRTVCPDGGSRTTDVVEPRTRGTKTVSLPVCPRGSTATIHTHITETELRSPEHSLPDWANVIHGDLLVSGVIGTQTAEWIVAPTDSATARAVFNDVLGIETRSPVGVVRALDRGDVRSPPAARQQLRTRLSSLVTTQSTNFTGLDRRLETVDVPRRLATASAPDYAVVEMSQLDATTAPDLGNLRKRARSAGNLFERIESRFNLSQSAVDTTVATVVGTLVGNAFS